MTTDAETWARYPLPPGWRWERTETGYYNASGAPGFWHRAKPGTRDVGDLARWVWRHVEPAAAMFVVVAWLGWFLDEFA